ncbi:CusA/CzcA family heavy metal efflux RND transporter [Comamonas testosteroni]|uniref:Heavy metal efflux pump, CzcA family n=1 Tax=Comamonas testosteroni (strain DSM 14576 / KF-1) TaxID=399795 RepID=B7WTM7_COMTK|nr:CusA/CzcA family heavy metal efflux RND transporter [Comamonas testosteroni]EED67433.1 heavy metal efflux pump, CzcA family [Comamonas testosteroni KF-1]WQG65599.1 CusA/CzcA family heavy metal efflux RND transporter [Comamonas testosteroni]
MIATLIRWSITNRFLVLIATAFLVAAGIWSASRTPVDALPDLSDVQVIVRTTYPGKPPQVVEDLVTYPLTTTMLSVPGAKTVRGYSFFGDSFVYILFDDKTDPYWARSRVVEYLNQVQSRLPAGATAALGPDATGVGWVYEYALVDRSGNNDIGQLRALNDWFLKFELKTVPDVAEVASIGGMVRQYQVVLDPDRMRVLGVTQSMVVQALQKANLSSGGSVVEMAETEYMVRSRGFLGSLEHFRTIPLNLSGATPLLLRDVATVQIGPEMRRGIAELDGEGEVTGGVVVMRSGKNARATIEAVKARLETLKPSLPKGVEVVETYDRSKLIDRAVDNLRVKLLEEFAVVAVVCAIFLFHLRSALVAVVTLPIGVLAAFGVMHWQGVSANILSLGGVAIALGAMVDASVVLVEAAHKHLEHFEERHRRPPSVAERWELIAQSAVEVGPALFFSLLVITLSFLPVFTLEAQEGRLFSPLAFTKTYAMAAAAGLSVTLVPVLMGYLIRGRIPKETANPINRSLIAIYRPALELVLRFPKATLLAAALALAITAIPVMRLGGEFMPPLDEGDLLYMPSALPGISVSKAAELLQQTDRLIKTVPEVKRVFGKAGRADTATDPAPLEMFETTIQFKSREQWRPGMTPEKLVEELDRVVKVPGLSNVWVPPIRNRIDMLATGIKSPVGIKVAGSDLATIDKLAAQIESAVRGVPGVSSALAERLTGGRYIDVDVDRQAAARFGLSVADVQAVIATAIGGENVGEVIQGRERFPVNVRYPREIRDSLERLRKLPFVTDKGATVLLQDVAKIVIAEGPPMIRSENARLSGWVYVDVRGRDLRSVVHDMQAVVAKQVAMPAGYALSWSGQFEYLERATERLKIVVPLTLAVIFMLLYVLFRSAGDAALVMAAVPFSLVGGFWFIWALGHVVSVASAVGFIALAGVAAEFGVVMLVYLQNAWKQHLAAGEPDNEATLLAAIREGAVMRVRPKAMTVAVVMAGLLPILVGHGTGSEVMTRIAAPMVGGMVTAPLLSMLVIPAAWYLIHRKRPRAGRDSSNLEASASRLHNHYTLEDRTMKTAHILAAAVALAAFTTTHAQDMKMPMQPAAGATSASMPLVDGEVRKIDVQKNLVVLRHGDIPNLAMPAMTMGFEVADKKMLDGLKVGDKVKFQAEAIKGKAMVTDLKPNH